jgi:hypothetical protein
MPELSSILQSMQDSFSGTLGVLLDYLPDLGIAALVLLAGWLVARLLRWLVGRIGRGLNRVLARLAHYAPGRRRWQLTQAMLKVMANVVFWLTLLVFLAMAAELARLELFTQWLDRLFAYLPTLFAGALIILAGYFVSLLVRDVVSAAMRPLSAAHSDTLGRLAQMAVVLSATVIGLDQIGVDTTFLTVLSAIIVGGLLLSLALAFGLGARGLVANLLGAQQLQRLVEPGQTVSIDGMQGQVLELTSTSIVLATSQGRLSVPAQLFQQKATLILTVDDHD